MTQEAASTLADPPSSSHSKLKDGTWRLPDVLHVNLSTDLHSCAHHEMEQFGWQSWWGDVYVLWELGGDGYPHPLDGTSVERHARPPPEDLRGFRDRPAEVADDGYYLRVLIGRVTAHTVRFRDVPTLPGATHVDDAQDLLYAVDDVSQAMSDIVLPLLGEGDQIFSAEVVAAAALALSAATGLDIDPDDLLYDSFDELLIMDETDLNPRFRGADIGAWVDAQVISALAPHESTLIAAIAAPLRRDEVMPATDADSWDPSGRGVGRVSAC